MLRAFVSERRRYPRVIYRVPSIHECMRKPHFGTVDGAIARALDDGQQVMIFGVEDDALGGSLRRALSESVPLYLPSSSRGQSCPKPHLEAF